MVAVVLDRDSERLAYLVRGEIEPKRLRRLRDVELHTARDGREGLGCRAPAALDAQLSSVALAPKSDGDFAPGSVVAEQPSSAEAAERLVDDLHVHDPEPVRVGVVASDDAQRRSSRVLDE